MANLEIEVNIEGPFSARTHHDGYRTPSATTETRLLVYAALEKPEFGMPPAKPEALCYLAQP
jgi:hypothetical protein